MALTNPKDGHFATAQKPRPPRRGFLASGPPTMTKHKRSIPNRSFRVADQIQRDLAELIRELKDPRVGLAHRQWRGRDARLRPCQGALLAAWWATPQDCEDALNEAAGLAAQRPVQAPGHPYRADTALRVRPHHRARGRAQCTDPPGQRLAREGRLKVMAPGSLPSHPPSVGWPAWGGPALGQAARCMACCCSSKPVALSSNHALQRAKRLLNADKAGHTGTLDPLATGLLPLCFGAATKFSQVSLDADKRYTATLDAGPSPPPRATARARPSIERRPCAGGRRRSWPRCTASVHRPASTRCPPMHSALKHEGRALYEYAREGIARSSATRRGTSPIHALDMLSFARCHTADAGRALQQGHLRAHPGRGHRRRAGLWRPSGRRCAAPAAARCRWTTRSPSMRSKPTWSTRDRDARLLPPDVLLADWPRHMAAARRTKPRASSPGCAVASSRRRLRRACGSTAPMRAGPAGRGAHRRRRTDSRPTTLARRSAGATALTYRGPKP